MQCVFPQLPIRRDEGDTRTFTPGELVCLRNDEPPTRVRGRYTRPYPQPETDRVMIHIVDNRWIHWVNVGKLEPAPVSPAAVSFVAREKNLPEDLERELKKYGGKTRRARKGRRKSQRRPPRSRRTR